MRRKGGGWLSELGDPVFELDDPESGELCACLRKAFSVSDEDETDD